MNIESKEIENIIVLIPNSEYIDASNIEAFRKAYDPLIEKSNDVILDLQATPIIVSGSEEPEADLLIFIIDDLAQKNQSADIDISMSLRPEESWIPVYIGGDQPHGDMELELPYSWDNEVFGENQPPSTSSDDALAYEWIGLSLDVDASIKEPGVYSWLRIGIRPSATAPVALDAVVVVDAVE